MTFYAIQNEEGLYLCEDEDVIGPSYDDLCEFTVFFSEKESAIFNSDGENVVEFTMSVQEIEENEFKIY